MTLPTWVDFDFAERTAAVMARRLSGSTAEWGRLFADAQAILASRTDTRDSEKHDSYDFEEWRDLVAAARILDLSATNSGIRDPKGRKNAAILAACAFGMSGTAVSASAVIKEHELLDGDLTPGELTVLALSSPNLCRSLFSALPVTSNYRRCIENIAAFLATGREELFKEASEALDQAIWEEGGAWEGYLLRNSRLALAHIGRLAVAKVLSPYESRFPSGYVDRLVSDLPTFLPSQYEAISEYRALAPDRNLLIALPTGTGKTLLGEMALLSSLGRTAGLACYIAPYVALGRQVAEKIRRHTPADVRVHQLVGGYQEPEGIDPENQLEVVVATPERFDALLRLRGDLLSSLRCVIFDEAHIIGNDQRGIRLEGLITRLRLAALRGDRVPRFVLLSAVLSNTDALATWMGITTADVVTGTWRPSAKRLLRWTQDGKLKLHAGDDPLRKGNPSDVLGEINLPWPNTDFYRAHHYGNIRQQEPRALGNIAYLTEFEYAQHERPVLCICASRSKTRRLATEIAERFPIVEPLPQSIQSIVDIIDRKYTYLRPLKEALLRGVAYHNSSLAHDLREAIEKAVESRDLKAVAATTTLAEGVDLPFRVTILADWLTFDGETERPMQSLLFKNIAGRCGRAGQFTEGDTVVFDNPVGEARLTGEVTRQNLQDQIFFTETQPVLASAIGRVNQQIAISAIGSQLLAAIPENPDVDDLPSSFEAFSFARLTEDKNTASVRIGRAFQEILDGSEGEPLAVVASPATLTAFGRAASSGGLSPKTAKRLRAVLGELRVEESTRPGLVRVAGILLKQLGSVDEQINPELRKSVTNPKSRPVVRVNSLEMVLELWLTGHSYEQIFAQLPSNQRSSRQPKLNDWLAGSAEESTWIEEFAKFYDFMSSCVEFFLPWLLRAARYLDESDGDSVLPWSAWARYVELGVDNEWAVLMLDSSLLTDRQIAQAMGERMSAVSLSGEGVIESARQILAETVDLGSQNFRDFMRLYLHSMSAEGATETGLRRS